MWLKAPGVAIVKGFVLNTDLEVACKKMVEARTNESWVPVRQFEEDVAGKILGTRGREGTVRWL